MAKQVKKWAQKVDLEEGSLTALGWPDGGKVVAAVRAGRVPYAKAIRKLVYLANVNKSSNPSTASKARAIIVRLQREFRSKKKNK